MQLDYRPDALGASIRMRFLAGAASGGFRFATRMAGLFWSDGRGASLRSNRGSRRGILGAMRPVEARSPPVGGAGAGSGDGGDGGTLDECADEVRVLARSAPTNPPERAGFSRRLAKRVPRRLESRLTASPRNGHSWHHVRRWGGVVPPVGRQCAVQGVERPRRRRGGSNVVYRLSAPRSARSSDGAVVASEC